MKRRVSDVITSILTFALLLLLAVALLVLGLNAFVAEGDALLVYQGADWVSSNPMLAGVALLVLAVVLAVLGEESLKRILPHRTAAQRGYVMQKNENGAIGVSIRAIEGLIRTCIEKHEAIAQADIQVQEYRDGIAIELHIIQAAGVNIPLSVGALQKQIKQYVTACTGVDVYRIGVMVENDESIEISPTYAVQDVTPLPTLAEAMETPKMPAPVEQVAIPAAETEMVQPMPETATAPETEDERPLHQRLFGMPEQPAIVPAPPEKPEEAEAPEAADDVPETDETADEATDEAAEETADKGDEAVADDAEQAE